jgi:hypothetical protein
MFFRFMLSILLKNFHLIIPSDIIIQRIVLSLQTTGELSNNQVDVYTILGIHDNVDRLSTDDKFTILNMSWKNFQKQTGIDVWDLWPDLQVIAKQRGFFISNRIHLLLEHTRKTNLSQRSTVPGLALPSYPITN